MPSRYPVEVRKQVVELARAGTRVAQLAETFGMSEAVIYGWLKQERIDRGEAPGLSTEGQMELAAAKRRIRELETELAVSRKVNEVFLEQNLPLAIHHYIEIWHNTRRRHSALNMLTPSEYENQHQQQEIAI
jgi:transposase